MASDASEETQLAKYLVVRGLDVEEVYLSSDPSMDGCLDKCRVARDLSGDDSNLSSGVGQPTRLDKYLEAPV